MKQIPVFQCQVDYGAEPILGSATRFGRVSATRQYSVLGRHKPAETEYWIFLNNNSFTWAHTYESKLTYMYVEAQRIIYL